MNHHSTEFTASDTIANEAERRPLAERAAQTAEERQGASIASSQIEPRQYVSTRAGAVAATRGGRRAAAPS